MENNLRKERQREGIQIAKLQRKYAGRKVGAVANKEKILQKYSDVVDLLEKSELSIRRIADISQTGVLIQSEKLAKYLNNKSSSIKTHK